MRTAHHSVCEEVNVGYTWPYYRLLDVIKMGSGFVQGYGLAQMLEDVTKLRAGSKHIAEVSKVSGVPVGDVKLRALRSIERLLSVQLGDWSSPGTEALFARYPCDMAEVAIAVALRLARLDQSVLDDADAFAEAIFQANVTNGFAVWRMFEPLVELVARAIPDVRPQKIRTCYAEAAGGDVRGDAGEMHILKVRMTIVNVQSSSDHKTKELCGRAIGLRYHWDGQKFTHRDKVAKMFLLLDGTWPQQELNALVRSGWDDIFYPDEMDRLAKAIV
jgi:hypothetical protein